jgi:hypothetical protein
VAVVLAVERLGAAGVLQQHQGGRRDGAAPREAARLPEHARSLVAAHADRVPAHQAGGEGVGVQLGAAALEEGFYCESGTFSFITSLTYHE